MIKVGLIYLSHRALIPPSPFLGNFEESKMGGLQLDLSENRGEAPKDLLKFLLA